MTQWKVVVFALIVVCSVAMPIAAMAGSSSPSTQEEQGIEAEIEQCRKDCMETTCAPQFRTCANTSGEASQTCKTLREDCEKRCVEIDCMT